MMADPDFLKIVDAEVLANEWGKLTRYRIEYRRRDGTWQEQVREAYDRGNGVTCLLYNPETGCVLLTRQFRLPVWLNDKDPLVIEAPAGMLDGAHPEDRMRAELVEETGFEISRLDHLFDVLMSPGALTEYLSFFSPAHTI
ncbi:NUDIX domain-containing protein [Roseibium salinum]|nr:NUDIX domain-containing protein [Roseibium salinum]